MANREVTTHRELDSVGGLLRDEITPPSAPAPPSPSLLIYSAIIVGASVILYYSFKVEGERLASLLMNFGSNIVVVIAALLFLDRRIRPSDLEFMMGIAGINALRSGFLSKQRDVIGYLRVFSRQLSSLNQLYIPSAELEELLQKYRLGFALMGAPGTGKTTFLYWTAMTEAQRGLRRPSHARIPVVIPLRQLVPLHLAGANELLTTEVLLRYIQQFYPVPDRRLIQLMTDGRVLLLLDGLDELSDSDSHARVTQDVLSLHDRFPRMPIIVTGRPASTNIPPEFLPRVDISDFSASAHRDLLAQAIWGGRMPTPTAEDGL